MLSEKVLFALNNVNDASLEQARRLLDRSVVPQRQAGRKIIRTFLIAAILAALMAATAYAIVSIHQKRQEELREKYKPAENHLTTYVEYSAPEETSDTITLLSAYNNGEVQTVYVNVKPVEQEEVRSIFMQDQQEDGRLYHLSYQFAIDDGEMNGWAEFLYPFEPERNYDPDSKTLSLSLSFRPTDYPDQDRFSIHLCSFDNWQTEDEAGHPALESMVQEIRRDFGTVEVELIPSDVRKVLFQQPVSFDNTETGETGQIIGIEIGPSLINWIAVHPDSGWIYGKLDRENEVQFQNDFAHQLSWIRATDDATADAEFLFSDGHRVEFSRLDGNTSQPDGTVKMRRSLPEAIDVRDVIAVTVNGKTISIQDN